MSDNNVPRLSISTLRLSNLAQDMPAQVKAQSQQAFLARFANFCGRRRAAQGSRRYRFMLARRQPDSISERLPTGSQCKADPAMNG